MPSVLRAVRRHLLAPSLEEVTFAARGFPSGDAAVVRRLEEIPQAVVCGFEWGVAAAGTDEIERRLSLVDPGLRGFGYEGATMACAVLDAIGPGRSGRTEALLRGPAAPHLFLAYIGIGFAMARLPRPLWKRVVPDLAGMPYHPTMSWLAVDGYGFDRAYFDTATWVHAQRRAAPYPWQDRPDYFPRAADQGVGRALWFIHGARVTDVAAAVRRFATDRQADLWSGVGLAAAFAGGADADGLAGLTREAGTHRAEVAQGAVFAARARSFAGHVPAHTERAVRVLARLGSEAATVLADAAAVTDERGRVPAYERWRAGVRERLGASVAEVH